MSNFGLRPFLGYMVINMEITSCLSPSLDEFECVVT